MTPTLDLAQTGRERLEYLVNTKRARLMFIVDDEQATQHNLKKNAELIDVTEINNGRSNARASFRIDWHAQGMPYGYKASTRYHHLGMDLKRITALEIVQKFGYQGVLTLTVGTRPAKTTDLAEAFKINYGLVMTTEDIVEEIIPEDPSQTCIMVRFRKDSIRYVGALRVNLVLGTTP